MATIADLIEQGNRAVARSARWTKKAPCWWTTEYQGHRIEIRWYGKERRPAIKLNGAEWTRFVAGLSFAGIQACAIERVDALLAAAEVTP